MPRLFHVAHAADGQRSDERLGPVVLPELRPAALPGRAGDRDYAEAYHHLVTSVCTARPHHARGDFPNSVPAFFGAGRPTVGQALNFWAGFKGK